LEEIIHIEFSIGWLVVFTGKRYEFEFEWVKLRFYFILFDIKSDVNLPFN